MSRAEKNLDAGPLCTLRDGVLFGAVLEDQKEHSAVQEVISALRYSKWVLV